VEVLGWLLIPLAGLVIGLAWAVWRSRDPKPVDAEQSMEDLARFREAMSKPLPPSQRRRPPQEDGLDLDPRDPGAGR